MSRSSSERDLTEQVYGYLAEDEDARVCKDIPEAACNDQPKAFVAHLIALSMTKLGDSLVSARLVLPWILASLGTSSVFISALVPLRESLALLPQLIIAQQMRETPVRKWFWVFGSVGQALSLVGMLLSVITLRGSALGWAIVILLTIFSISRGVCSVSIKDVQGKTISKTRRGRLSGIAASVAGLLSVLTALVVLMAPTLLGGTLEQGNVLIFSGLLGTAAVLWLAAAATYAQVPEVPGATEGGGNAMIEALKSMRLLWQNKQFGSFVLTRALLVSSAFAIPFIVVMIQRSGEGSLTSLGGLMLANGIAGMMAGRFWGKWSDSASHYVMAAAAFLAVLIMASALALYSFAEAWLAQQWLAGLLIFAAAVAHHGARVGRKTYLVDMATADNRAQLTAVSNTVIGGVLLLGILLGALDSYAGVEAVMVTLIVLGSIAGVRALTLPNVQRD
ncbi:MFS transporter permease [Pseudidiomarina terrestris]|uniref:MFS transporter permease n=1 Tax=Pseudidiomarina terrestris TaxID=2820060 RepID=UPI00264F0F35|nr:MULTISPECIES: MFS transporter permease [unclassified Pseudidiomarina]MDN7135875.1 MFS transporter permease [Pseudidiomarina sp. 1ASP75-5]MDN7138185.1 MFS transporter permease [Pseudidiomarina sp. 1ASP75-14]MEA3588040.1 MFS transporter permease [Pseudidiomarina sp. 1APP75-27a]